MKEPVLSTNKVLMKKAFNYDIDESWVDWAIEMIEAGFESENLYILAGISKPYNQFELQELTNKVLKDLHLDYSDKYVVIKKYVYYLITELVNKPDTYLKTLRELKGICIDLDLDKNYMDFYLLYFAKEDLIELDNQCYWNGADRGNIDQIITEQFINWMTKFELEERNTNI